MLLLFSLLNKFLITYAFSSGKAIFDCSIILPDDIKTPAPVILTSFKANDFQLFKPAGKVTNLKEGSRLMLVCSGHKNNFKNSAFNKLQLTCLKGNFVDSKNNIQLIKNNVCNMIPSSSMEITNEKCFHGKGFIYKIGFPTGDQFYGPLFQTCYSNITETTFYTHNILNGAAIYHSISESRRRPFTADGMQFSTANTNSFYTKENQIERFNNYFGPDQTYIDEKNFLARGHLTADADFIFPYEQLATYYYVNVAPEFQVINVGNWLRVEQLARDIAASYNDDIESYNGYFEVLKLPKKNDDLVKIYLDDTQKIEAPRYFYKILLHRASNAAIVFITINNPYINDGPAEELCTNVCKKSGLEHVNFRDVKKGYTYCCELKEFKLFIDSLPRKVQAKKLLKHRKLYKL